MKVTLLAELTCLNKLVNNKVVVLDVRTETYRSYNFGKYTVRPTEEDFNPDNYALLQKDDYTIIIEATPKMKEQYLVNKYWKEQCKNPLHRFKEFTKSPL